MKVAIVSDLHANMEALESFPEECDELWVLGDLVTYGPNPAEVVDAVRARASLIVRGNHDHAAGAGEDPRCSEAFRSMAAATLDFARAALGPEQKAWLASLPLTAERTIDGTRFFLCHAVPSDPLYAYCCPDSPRWRNEAASVQADIVLVGHTHLPFKLQVDGRLVVNPGSLGQPKNGLARASYAVWQNGKIELRSYEYPVEVTVGKILVMPVPGDIRRRLADVLRSGGNPIRNRTNKETSCLKS
jgi:putative phosphoesterase